MSSDVVRTVIVETVVGMAMFVDTSTICRLVDAVVVVCVMERVIGSLAS